MATAPEGFLCFVQPTRWSPTPLVPLTCTSPSRLSIKSGGGSPKADEVVDEYTDDHDPGYVVLEVTEDETH